MSKVFGVLTTYYVGTTTIFRSFVVRSWPPYMQLLSLDTTQPTNERTDGGLPPSCLSHVQIGTAANPLDSRMGTPFIDVFIHCPLEVTERGERQVFWIALMSSKRCSSIHRRKRNNASFFLSLLLLLNLTATKFNVAHYIKLLCLHVRKIGRSVMM